MNKHIQRKEMRMGLVMHRFETLSINDTFTTNEGPDVIVWKKVRPFYFEGSAVKYNAVIFGREESINNSQAFVSMAWVVKQPEIKPVQ